MMIDNRSGMNGHKSLLTEVSAATNKLLSYCEENEWAGHDPYDALNSGFFEALRLLNSRIPRLVLTQVLKRSPINVRGFLRVPKTQNAKALALFLSAFLKLSTVQPGKHEDRIRSMVERLILLRSQKVAYWCWGYSFPWQTRTFLVPRGAPNLVCTTFVANALIDAHEQTGEYRYLEMAISSAEYILNQLYWTCGEDVAGFAYPLPSMRHNVHNGNFLGASLFCRIARYTGETRFLEPALKVTRYSASKQHADGSWEYGELPTQRWIDNFHTGYNLCSLRSISRNLRTPEFEEHIRRGFNFYRDHFFRDDGAPKYFHDRTYPIDIHCVAQRIITLLCFKDLDPDNIRLAHSVFRWVMDHMWDDRGFFYYRIRPFCTIRTSYMRWSQAWMFLAMSMLFCDAEVAIGESHNDDNKAWCKHVDPS